MTRKLTFRNTTRLPLQINGVETPEGLCIVVSLAELPECVHAPIEVRRVSGSFEWCRCCGAYRVGEAWIRPTGGYS